MGITLLWETAKLFLTLTAGLYTVVALVVLIYLPFCIADCLRQRRGMGQWASAKSRTGASPAPEAAPLQRAPVTLSH
ncbi:MAG TPA: hypothetical protein VGH16_10370 [Candidatus Binatia bacterium]|jgi:hypothetical protein